MHKKICSSDISVVVQGAIDKIATPRCLSSIRTFLPKAQIILSTWKNEKIEGLEYDMLIQSDDPGACIYDFQYMSINNINRQLVSSYNGIKQAERKYIIKMRSDLILTNNFFLNFYYLFSDFEPEYHLLKKRILTLSLYSREFVLRGIKKFYVPFYVSDWFLFGTAEDIKDYFDIPLITNLKEYSQYFLEKDETVKRKLPFPTLSARLTPEQYICSQFVKKHIPGIAFDDMLDNTAFNVFLSKKVLLNNFIFLDYKHSGIYNEKWMDISRNETNLPLGDAAGLILYDYFRSSSKSFRVKRIHFITRHQLICKYYKNLVSAHALHYTSIILGIFKALLLRVSPAYKVASDVRKQCDVIDYKLSCIKAKDLGGTKK